MDGSGLARLLIALSLTGLPLAALLAGLAAARQGRGAALARALAVVAALAGAGAGAVALAGLPGGELAWFTGWPGDPQRAGVDALAAPFVLIAGLVAAATLAAWPLAGARAAEARRVALHAAFAAGLVTVFAARHALLLFGGWEAMTLASAALVADEASSARARRAAFAYVGLSQLGAAALAAALGSLAAAANSLQLPALLAALPGHPHQAMLVGLLTLAAAVKLGLVPVHGWLPLAHPEAPAPGSALMSGAMVTAGLYLLLRAVWQPLGTPPAAWGVTLVVAGVASALTGALSAALDTDAKRVLAWSTVKHMGVLACGTGLAATLAARGAPEIAGIALAAVTYHALGHALAKPLAFLAVGDAAHALGTRDLEHWGGLWRTRPRAFRAAVLALPALAGVPLLPLFASEWLLFQVLLLGRDAGAGDSPLALLAPFAAAGLALAGALSLAAMVRLLGIGFLGRPRDPARTAHDAPDATGPAAPLLVAFAVAWGVGAPFALHGLAAPVRALLPGFDPAAVAPGALALVAGAVAPAGVSPLALATLVGGLAAFAAAWARGGAGVRTAPSWSCGAPLEPRQQYSAAGLSQPLRRVFASVITDDANPVAGRAWHPRAVFEALAQGVLWSSDRVRRLQSGRLELYLGLLLATLVGLLVWGR